MQSLFQYNRIRREVQLDLEKLGRSPFHGSLSSPPKSSLGERDDNEPRADAPRDDEVKEADTKISTLPPGVSVSATEEKGGDMYYIVSWKDDDPNNPYNWSLPKKWMAMVTCCVLSISITLVSSVEGPTTEAFDEYYGVNALAGSTATTGIFLIGIGFGSLFSGPFSETFGRNAIYFSTMVLVMIFIMAKALAPNYGAALVFRFLCAIFAATPMTVAGGTIGDIWTPMQIPFGLPFTTICAYAGPILGPIIGAYTPDIGFQWADWISMILIAAALVFVFLLQPETYGPVLLEWRAKHFRELTGDNRYRTEHESTASLPCRLLTNSYRPFTMVWTEPIILIFTFYLVLLYFVLFTFLNGYEYIFSRPYGLSNGLTYILWTAMLPGIVIAVAMIPLLYHLTKKAAAKAEANGQTLQPEMSLYWAMAGASILMPISLFWMGWTCYSDISIWSPIIASFVFGYSLVCIFTTSYMYIIFVYLQYAASALGFMTFARYVIAGALIPASIVMYEKIGPHWSLTISGIVASLMAPVPFVLYKYGHKVRAMSKNVQNKA